ncbi:uncharacterized protein LOC132186957 [Corylus avellana]|uniref:uncharacterized protein LOC132186957 n=1 Tax=Corylus avellana TaxID=13451 RepID=UPI001E23BD6E|nr:uncharacterized protein LOC132186957 [Corylus avellana]
MGESVGDAKVWYHSQFLTNDDPLMDKENFNKRGVNAGFAPGFSFPTEFPYEFDSLGPNSSVNSPVESVAGSTETEGSDEEEFFAGLTRRLTQFTLHETQKLAVKPSLPQNKPEWVMAGSPQSTLSGIGSWSGRSAVSSNGSPNGPSQFPSPPTTPFGAKNDTWDLIYAAAGQVARLKMGGESPKYNYQSRGLLAPPKTTNPTSAAKSCSFGLYSNQSLTHNLPQTTQFQHLRQDQVLKSQRVPVWERQQEVKVGWSTQPHQQEQQIQNRVRNTTGYESGRCGKPMGLPQSAWPSLQAQQQNQLPRHHGSGTRAGYLGGSGVKRESAGTGVFLPRRYNSAPECCKKTACPTVIVPAKVVQALNLNFDDMGGHAQPRFNTGYASDHDAVVARANAILMQQRRSLRPEGALNHEIRLPQEWTY